MYGPKLGVDYGHFTHIGWQFRTKFRAEYDPLCKNYAPHDFCAKTMRTYFLYKNYVAHSGVEPLGSDKTLMIHREKIQLD